MKLWLISFLFFLNFAYAADDLHREQVLKISSALPDIRVMRKLIWLSAFDINADNPNYFKDSSGHYLLGRPSVITSAYDSYVSYDATNFYNPKSQRVKMIANMALFDYGTILSIGYDNGVQSEKFVLNNSFFLGATKMYEVGKKSYFTVSLGKWFGGKVKETPCYDAYDRAYWCQNLTAWSDYQPNYPKGYSYLDISYVFKFVF